MKGQFTWDYIVSIAAFIAIVAYLSLQMINKAPSTLDTIRAEYLRSEAYQISEQLINNPGYPQDWETLQLSSLTDLVWQETNVLDTQASINSIAIGDVDGDSKNDIVAVTNAEVLQLKQINNKWTSALIGNVPGGKTVAIGNVMLDSGNEIVVGALQTGSPNLVLYNYSGIGLGFNPPVSIATLNININSVVIGNADNDPANESEIVIGTDFSSIIGDYELRYYKLVGSVWQEFLIDDTLNNVNSIAIGDVDNDGANEILVGLNNAAIIGQPAAPNQVFYYKYIGGVWIMMPIANPKEDIRSVAIGDVDNDGENEAVFVSKIGTGLWMAKNVLGIWQTSQIDPIVDGNSVAIGNVDNDLSNTNEIVVNNLNELKYYKNVSTPIWEAKTIKTMPTTINSIAMEDADNAGKIKTAVGLQSPTQFELRYYKDSIARLGLSNADKDVTNYLSFPKINAFNLSCTSNYGDVATLLGLDVNKYNFSITLIDITNPDPPLINCYPSTSLTRSINTTLSRYVTLDNGDVGEMIIQIW